MFFEGQEDKIWYKFQQFVCFKSTQRLPEFIQKLLCLPQFSFGRHFDDFVASEYLKTGKQTPNNIIKALLEDQKYGFVLKRGVLEWRTERFTFRLH